jgi:hypothetical protein
MGREKSPASGRSVVGAWGVLVHHRSLVDLTIDFPYDASCIGNHKTWAILDFVVDPR